jgi:RNA polymerase sigma factor (sigma-70 family)
LTGPSPPRLRLGIDADYGARSDAELLDAYAGSGDARAFEVIVRRHGPMVLGVCRRVLRHDHDADDAFQATFLVLAHKAKSVSPSAALAAWLHGVARRTSLRARSRAARRAAVERQVPPRTADPAPAELDPALDEELGRLPERYRVPIVLCDLEGRLRSDVAAALGCAEGTLSARLTRGRRLLADRLRCRGVTVPAALAATAVAESLVSAAARFALPPIGTQGVSPNVGSLAKGVMTVMALKKLVMLGAIVVALVAAGLAVGAVGRNPAPAPVPGPVVQEPPPRAPAQPVTLKGHTKAVSAVTWAANGKAMATASDDRTVRVWDAGTGKQTASLTGVAREGYGGPVVAFTADLKVVAVNYWGAITIRTVADDKVIARIDPILDRGQKSAFRPDVFALAFSPDGKQLATAGSVAAVGGGHGLPGGIVVVWDAETGKLVHKSDVLSTAASSVGWSADGKRYVAGTNGAGGELPEAGEVRVWDAETGRSLHSFKVKPEVNQGEWASAGDVAFAPDGKRVAAPVTAGSRGAPAGLLIDDTGASVRVWDLETGKGTQPVKGLKASVGRVAFSPNGKLLATAGGDKMVRVWDAESGKELAALPGPDRVTVVAFSPDGTLLAAGSRDGSVRIIPVTAAK